MNKSLSLNAVYYFVYNILNVLFPFFTSVYIARILPPIAIGEVAYAQNIVSYFAIFAFLGLPTYGLREISKVRNDYDALCGLFSELFIINLISTFVFSFLYYGMVFFVSDFRQNLVLYLVVGITVILNMLNISWLYEGMEEFRYVSIRNAVFKFLMFLLLLLFVNSPDDMIPYVAITVFGVAGNNIVNMLHSRKFVKMRWHGLQFVRHLRPIFLLVLVNFAIEIYSLLGTSMLGFFSTKESVAFYSYASKVNGIFLQIANTITIVLVPRIALYYSEGKMEEFNRLLTQALKIIVLFSVPIIIGIQFTAEFLFCQVFGDAYIRAAYVEKLLCFILLIAPIGYLLGSRVMLVSGNESKMVLCVSVGALVNAFSNYCLVRPYGELGTAIAAVIGEIVVAVLYVNFGRKIFNLQALKKNFINVVFASAAMTIYLGLIKEFIPWGWGLLLAEILGASLIYTLMLLVLKDSVFCEYGKRLMMKF